MEIPSTEQISCWLPFLVSPLELEDFLANKELYPASLPLTKEGFYLNAAFLRSQLAGNVEAPRKVPISLGPQGKLKGTEGTEAKELVLAPKFLSAVPSPGMGLLLAVDAFQPRQILKIFAEKEKIQEKLGTVISLTEVDKKKKILGKVEFIKDLKQTLQIKPEEIIQILVDKDTELMLDFRLGGAKVLGKTKTRISVSGGRVGVIIDGRGRPIEFGEEEEGREKIKRWTSVFW